ncbi:MAG: ATP-dependent protease subunit HslV [Candidatus Caldatribacteriota bacterium]|jgi:ATP-dependent HslUV protease subunit HslV|nr:ATP-dependent protease subunit HslV [Atribacterota bacterium]MDD3031050.1 ATP-dependent protease subunit HslV [Atribacterota bacterium]MDD3640209.1 ATP-dependent protease subunit HslV [Atribacterota bacterium]MDD4288517.1 ATP-dependent protease subunit HslV [Atribacterota bacterium]MDD4764245.1 ATP-dependent protease subunit HslV [Atribacterota bacterium]
MYKGTTIIAVRREDEIAIAGDGQITMGNTIAKNEAKKIRKIYHGKVLTGFAGGAADALTLYERFENKLEEFQGNLKKASIELAKDWRTDKMLRRLEALLIVADLQDMFTISGNGDIIEPDKPIAAIGSGGQYAMASAQALLGFTKLSASEIAMESLKITASICIYTNNNISVECLRR